MQCVDSDNQQQMGILPPNEWTERMMAMLPGTTSTPSSSSSSSAAANMATATATAAAAAALKCPRCDSSNTKFCYYNNYSLSQPRHFCKACKRYWTRGGTLRNVPVGGGCRKNKRVKKIAAAAPNNITGTVAAAAATVPVNSNHPQKSSTLVVDRASDLNSFLYGISADVNPTCFPTSSCTAATAYDLQPQLSALGLGFASNHREFDANNNVEFQQQPIFGGYPNFGSLKPPKKVVDEYQGLLPYEHLQGDLGFPKGVKAEGSEMMINRVMSSSSNSGMEWNVPNFDINPFDPMTAAIGGDSSYLYWNFPAIGGGGWSDAANSSVAPLI